MARYRATDDPGERRIVGVTVHLTPTERKQLGDAARQEGAPIGDYIRQMCLRRGGQPQTVSGVRHNPDAKALADELRHIGINLNQLARVANQDGNLHREEELSTTIDLLVAALSRVISL